MESIHSQDRNQQNLSDISDTVPGHRLAIAKIGEQEPPRSLLRLPAQDSRDMPAAEYCRPPAAWFQAP